MPSSSSQGAPLSALTRRRNGEVVAQILALGSLLISSERVNGVLIGTYAEATLPQLGKVDRCMRGMLSEGWERGL